MATRANTVTVVKQLQHRDMGEIKKAPFVTYAVRNRTNIKKMYVPASGFKPANLRQSLTSTSTWSRRDDSQTPSTGDNSKGSLGAQLVLLTQAPQTVAPVNQGAEHNCVEQRQWQSNDGVGNDERGNAVEPGSVLFPDHLRNLKQQVPTTGAGIQKNSPSLVEATLKNDICFENAN